MIARTCECGHAESVDPASYPTHCPKCRARWCPYCWVRPAVRRWVPMGCQGTPFHVTVCAPCHARQSAADRLTPAERAEVSK